MTEAEFSIQTPTDNVLTLDQAVLLYHGRSGGALATVHEVLTVDGAPVIGAGHAMTAQAARELGGSVAIKAVSAHIVHKSDMGGVKLGLQGDAAVLQACADIAASTSASLTLTLVCA